MVFKEPFTIDELIYLKLIDLATSDAEVKAKMGDSDHIDRMGKCFAMAEDIMANPTRNKFNRRIYSASIADRLEGK